MAAGGPHLADTGKKLLEEPVFTTHSPAAVAWRQQTIIATNCPKGQCWAAAGHGVQKHWLQASPCSGEAKSTKEKEGTNPSSDGGNRGQVP